MNVTQKINVLFIYVEKMRREKRENEKKGQNKLKLKKKKDRKSKKEFRKVDKHGDVCCKNNCK